jgi:hypothetical protein
MRAGTLRTLGTVCPPNCANLAAHGTWHPTSQAWIVPDDKADEARKFVADADPASARASCRAFRHQAVAAKERTVRCCLALILRASQSSSRVCAIHVQGGVMTNETEFR